MPGTALTPCLRSQQGKVGVRSGTVKLFFSAFFRGKQMPSLNSPRTPPHTHTPFFLIGQSPLLVQSSGRVERDYVWFRSTTTQRLGLRSGFTFVISSHPHVSKLFCQQERKPTAMGEQLGFSFILDVFFSDCFTGFSSPLSC